LGNVIDRVRSPARRKTAPHNLNRLVPIKGDGGHDLYAIFVHGLKLKEHAVNGGKPLAAASPVTTALRQPPDRQYPVSALFDLSAGMHLGHQSLHRFSKNGPFP
jgi:hypothetical protein